MMEDISDEELNKIQNKASTPDPSGFDGVSDEELIKLHQQTMEKKSPIKLQDSKLLDQTTSQNVETKKVEPKKPMMDLPEGLPQETSSNYWKITGLPSMGKFYNEDSEVVGRPMKVLEVKKISSMSEENGDFIINDIIRKTVRGIDIKELYVADKLYIIFWLRANTYRDSGYVIPFVCPKCEAKTDYHFEVSNLEIQSLSDDFNPKAKISLLNGDIITYNYLKIKDEIFIDRFKELNSQTAGEIDDELLGMAQMVKTINGKEKSLLEKYNWIVNIEPGDYSYLKSYMEKKGMGLKPFVNVECKECGGTAPVGVSFREDFLIPEYKFD